MYCSGCFWRWLWLLLATMALAASGYRSDCFWHYFRYVVLAASWLLLPNFSLTTISAGLITTFSLYDKVNFIMLKITPIPSMP